MKKTRTINVPATTEEVFQALVCDLCGRKTTREDGWGRDQWQIRRVRLEIVEGEYSNIGENTKTTGYDVCPTCWRQKVVPFMVGHGAIPRTIDANWG